MSEKIESLAAELYWTYCVAVGGKAFNGDPLPAWAEFSKDEKKQVQVNGWRAAAEKAIAVLQPSH